MRCPRNYLLTKKYTKALPFSRGSDSVEKSEGAAGYIGALGSMKMQQDRADWLAYQDVTDLSRVFGPAGVDISASSPVEIAISVLAQAIAELKKN